MTKVVYNACYGGFGVSEAAVLRAREISGNPNWGGEHAIEYGSIDEIPRHDPILVQVVEELGDEASGNCASLKITEISGRLYRIDEYDGRESVQGPGDIDWVCVD